jgi:molybdenum cofactor cytidylyltransferase
MTDEQELGSRKVVGAILAAGSSSRFGSAKQLAIKDGQTLLARASETLLATAINQAIVVLGCHSASIKESMTAGKNKYPEIVENNDWQEGIASSIRCATAYAVGNQASHLLLMVCDQPLVTPELLNQLLAASCHQPEAIIACNYADSVGIPALFPQSRFAQLLTLCGDKGAKSIICQGHYVSIDFAGGAVDIDRPADLQD